MTCLLTLLRHGSKRKMLLLVVFRFAVVVVFGKRVWRGTGEGSTLFFCVAAVVLCLRVRFLLCGSCVPYCTL